MEIVLKIDDKDIRFKSNAATPLRYKAAFRKDLFSDLIYLATLENIIDDDGNFKIEDLEGLDFDIIYRYIWILAKTADGAIPPLLEWLDQFDDFPVFEIFADLMPIMTSFIRQETKKKSKPKNKAKS